MSAAPSTLYCTAFSRTWGLLCTGTGILFETLSRTFFSIPHFNSGIHHFILLKWGIHFQHWFPMPELPSKEEGIGRSRKKSIPDFISRVKELTSSINSQFLPLLEGNSGIVKRCRKWIPHFRSVKWWILELKWGIEKNVLLKLSNRSKFFQWTCYWY